MEPQLLLRGLHLLLTACFQSGCFSVCPLPPAFEECHQPQAEKLRDLADHAHIRLHCNWLVLMTSLGRVIRKKCWRIENLNSFLRCCSHLCCRVGRVLHDISFGGYCLNLRMHVMQTSSGCQQLQIV